jgi:hypothetical protein
MLLIFYNTKKHPSFSSHKFDQCDFDVSKEENVVE